MHTAQQNPNIKKCADILSRDTSKAMVLNRYGSTPEEAQKWGYVKNTWEDEQFQNARFNAFIEKAMKGDPWRDVNGKDFF